MRAVVPPAGSVFCDGRQAEWPWSPSAPTSANRTREGFPAEPPADSHEPRGPVERRGGRVRGAGEELAVPLDAESRNELAMLRAAMGTDADELVRRAVHALFRTTVDSADLDFHLRSAYDVTYDEYLSGMTYDEMTGGDAFPQPEQNDDRRYQF